MCLKRPSGVRLARVPPSLARRCRRRMPSRARLALHRPQAAARCRRGAAGLPASTVHRPSHDACTSRAAPQVEGRNRRRRRAQCRAPYATACDPAHLNLSLVVVHELAVAAEAAALENQHAPLFPPAVDRLGAARGSRRPRRRRPRVRSGTRRRGCSGRTEVAATGEASCAQLEEERERDGWQAARKDRRRRENNSRVSAHVNGSLLRLGSAAASARENGGRDRAEQRETHSRHGVP